MIKQSFLRNYSLCKIYSQAEDEKKKLKVFYIRKVNKILKEKQQKERREQILRKSMDNKQSRFKQRREEEDLMLLRAQKRKKGALKENKIEQKMVSKEEQVENSKQKADLRVTEVRFQDNEDLSAEFLRQNMHLKTSLNKSFHSSKRLNTKNFLCKTIYAASKGENMHEDSLRKTFFNPINRSSEASCESPSHNRKTMFLFSNQCKSQDKDQHEEAPRRNQQKMTLTPLKINCSFRRKQKNNQKENKETTGPTFSVMKIL